MNKLNVFRGGVLLIIILSLTACTPNEAQQKAIQAQSERLKALETQLGLMQQEVRLMTKEVVGLRAQVKE